MTDQKPEIQACVEVYTGASEVMHTIEELSRAINEMLMSAKSSESGAEIKPFLIQIRVQKNNQEGIKKRFYEFMTHFLLSYGYQSLEFFKSSDKGFGELKVAIEGFKKEEDDLKERINHLMVKFSKSKVSGDRDVGVWTAVGEQVKSKDESHFTDKGLKGLKIRDNYFMEADNRHDSTDIIADGFEQKSEGDDSFHSSEYEICTGTEGDDDVISDFEEIKALGLEGKMIALMQATKVLFKKDQDVANKSLIKWIQDFDEDTTGKEWTALKKVKDRAVELGDDVCRLLGDLMFRLSERELVLGKFHEFKSALASLTENMISSMVCKRLIGALEIADKQIKKKEEMNLGMKKSSEAGSSSAGKQAYMSKEESQIDQLLIKFYREVYQLDSMLKNPGLPESKLLPPSNAVVKKYKEAVKRIDKAVKKLKTKSASIFNLEVLNFNHYWRKMVELKINYMLESQEESDDTGKEKD
ncbi:hypothetical protein Dsin_020285 [Dipteronia sinensis]|uniref:Uncharacterized protein n=1 Tax=Dipteronia sinensis TaxID=43782 RepID=A0AAE0A9Q8_9ROSI|nr:hypothetical protein Dsin_020285 [Dipteronia sinensis]